MPFSPSEGPVGAQHLACPSSFPWLVWSPTQLSPARIHPRWAVPASQNSLEKPNLEKTRNSASSGMGPPQLCAAEGQEVMQGWQ